MELKGKKVLQMGLGTLGGGVATTKWLLEQGAVLTVTDLNTPEYLQSSLEKLDEFRDHIKFVLGRHEENDFLENDIIVVNPGVPVLGNKFLELSKGSGKQIENELTLFYKFCPTRKIVAVTGTRGKTTTVNWIAHLLKSANPDTLIIGNSPEKPFLQEIKKCSESTNVVLEVPSFHLEICDKAEFAPHVAVITNLYRDHVNWHKTMEGYASAKANIFKHQTENDFLILNKENEWTDFFLSQKPRAKVLFCSKDDEVENGDEFVKEWGAHNLQNFKVASMVARIFGISAEDIKKQISGLPQVKFRQEKVYDDGRLQVFNDTAATSPEALIASMERFLGSEGRTVFISGGTDRDLDFGAWGRLFRESLDPENLILLAGSATEKMKKELGWGAFNEFETLDDCFQGAIRKVKDERLAKIVFSPGAKSFEKFKNEFDRGEQFNLLVNKLRK